MYKVGIVSGMIVATIKFRCWQNPKVRFKKPLCLRKIYMGLQKECIALNKSPLVTPIINSINLFITLLRSIKPYVTNLIKPVFNFQ